MNFRWLSSPIQDPNNEFHKTYLSKNSDGQTSRYKLHMFCNGEFCRAGWSDRLGTISDLVFHLHGSSLWEMFGCQTFQWWIDLDLDLWCQVYFHETGQNGRHLIILSSLLHHFGHHHHVEDMKCHFENKSNWLQFAQILYTIFLTILLLTNVSTS